MMRERAPRSTLVPTPGVVADLLSWRARHQAERTAYVFLLDGETDAVVLTYGELDLQARRVAAELRRSAAAGKPVILCYPPGLEYIPAFLGCFYAGAVAVPAYAPEARRLQRTLPRLAAICENVGAEIALTSPACFAEVASLFRRRPELGNVSVRAVDTTAGDVLDHGREAATTPDEIAFLMYTSGSTGSPKGAMISHASVLHNLSTFPGFHSRPPRGFVCWLPFFHDLGLMMGILHPLYRGVPGILMAPLTFAQRPLRWLEAISRYRATTTGGPNFAYGLCVAKSDARERQRLDLSSWNLALNGSEPVRQQTLERFTAAFTASGFRRESFYPSYGLAEATATVTGACTLEPPVYAFVHRSDAERGRATPTSPRESERVMPLVGCGPGIVDQEIAIVDPLTRSRCAPTEIGEIWVRGPSIAQGYWRRPAETEELLRARLADTGEGPFLRTGDLGFLDDGELYLSGRLKDLIIVHGANHHPEDVELTLAAAHPAVRPGCGAVFAVEQENEERVVVVQEVRLSEDLERREVVSRIRAGVAEEHGLELHAVVLVRPGTIPKTSSGKLRRSACRKEYREGSLAVVGEWQGGAVTVAPGAPSDEPPTGTAIENRLVTYLARELCLPPTAIDVRQPFARFGLPSIGAVAMVAEIESWLGRRLPPTLAWDHPSIEALARHLGEEPSAAVITSEPEAAGDEPIAIVGMSCRLPGAPHLEAYWQLLRNGIDAVTEIPPERWDVDAFYDPDPAAPGKMVTRWGGFLADLDRFDAAFFGLSPREAIHLDPQQRVLMELAWEALEDAGIPPFSLAGSRAGVFIATLSNDYGTNL
ncbi:MAG: AMP-binding protein, partial [bacterium]|nr:AMP-binding protein [bacterium]